MTSASGPLAGEPRKREPASRSRAAWAGSWLAWWVLLLSFWIAVDDSLAVDEVLAGAGAAAIAAFIADLALYQAAVRLRIRPRWLVPALRLPGQVAADTLTVYAALWRRMVRGEQPVRDRPHLLVDVRPGPRPPGRHRPPIPGPRAADGGDRGGLLPS